jgi:hypothetical protein
MSFGPVYLPTADQFFAVHGAKLAYLKFVSLQKLPPSCLLHCTSLVHLEIGYSGLESALCSMQNLRRLRLHGAIYFQDFGGTFYKAIESIYHADMPALSRIQLENIIASEIPVKQRFWADKWFDRGVRFEEGREGQLIQYGSSHHNNQAV